MRYCRLSTSASAWGETNACVCVCVWARGCRMLEINSTPVQIIRNITHFLYLMNSLSFGELTHFVVIIALRCVLLRLRCTHLRKLLHGRWNALLGNEIGGGRFNRFICAQTFWENKFPLNLKSFNHFQHIIFGASHCSGRWRAKGVSNISFSLSSPFTATVL